MDFWYLRPGLAKLAGGKLGRDYFESKDAVVEFVGHNGAHWHDACLRHPHYSLGQLWSTLKVFGWTCKKAGRSMPLLDHVWLPPGVDHVTWHAGERGVDWFGGHDELNELITSIRATEKAAKTPSTDSAGAFKCGLCGLSKKTPGKCECAGEKKAS
jgi:hypothetical protein